MLVTKIRLREHRTPEVGYIAFMALEIYKNKDEKYTTPSLSASGNTKASGSFEGGTIDITGNTSYVHDNWNAKNIFSTSAITGRGYAYVLYSSLGHTPPDEDFYVDIEFSAPLEVHHISFKSQVETNYTVPPETDVEFYNGEALVSRQTIVKTNSGKNPIVASAFATVVSRDGKIYYRAAGKLIKKVAIKITKPGSVNISGLNGFGDFRIYNGGKQYPLAITSHGKTRGYGVITGTDTTFTVNSSGTWTNSNYWYCTYAITPLTADDTSGYSSNWLPDGTGGPWTIEFSREIRATRLSFGAVKELFAGGDYLVTINDNTANAETVTFPLDNSGATINF